MRRGKRASSASSSARRASKPLWATFPQLPMPRGTLPALGLPDDAICYAICKCVQMEPCRCNFLCVPVENEKQGRKFIRNPRRGPAGSRRVMRMAARDREIDADERACAHVAKHTQEGKVTVLLAPVLSYG